MTAPVAAKPQHVIVVGAGRMGRGIASSCAIAGVPVALIDLKHRSTEDAVRIDQGTLAEISRDLQFLASIQLLDAGEIPSMLAKISVLRGVAAEHVAAHGDIFFEGLPETLESKTIAFDWISRHALPSALVASTTSTMDVNQLATLVAHPGRFLNAHWLNPAHLMPLVEIAVGTQTSPETVQRMRAMLMGLGKVPVVCSASPGYIVPRIQALAMNEAARLVQEGVASAEDIDTAVRVGFGLRFAVLGLLEFIDWGGNDILYYASGHLSRSVDAARYAAPEIIERNMREGRNGLREGHGFYDYEGRDVEAYRRDRLEQFVKLIGHLNLLPPGLLRRPRAPE